MNSPTVPPRFKMQTDTAIMAPSAPPLTVDTKGNEMKKEQRVILNKDPKLYSELRISQVERAAQPLKDLGENPKIIIPNEHFSRNNLSIDNSPRTIHQIHLVVFNAFNSSKGFPLYKGNTYHGFTDFYDKTLERLKHLIIIDSEYPIVDRYAARYIHNLIPEHSHIVLARNSAISAKSIVENGRFRYNFTLSEIFADIKKIIEELGFADCKSNIEKIKKNQ
uniref:Response regulatory domain-containing protein n=1 Tax=Parastrongyloides trichosuri TaxID=131310 RepID=A0A0N5A0C4_PARTI